MSSENTEMISVIMPCFNASRFVKGSIESVLSQTYTDFELIIVDDGSTDDSAMIIKSFSDQRLKYFFQKNSGVCVARNHGLSVVSGNYIAFLDADDKWHPACLEKLYTALQQNPNAALAYCGWQNCGLPGGRGEPFIPPDYETDDKIEKLLTGCRWPIHATLTRAANIHDAGGFDERFPTSEDYWLWLVIACHYQIVRVPEVLAYYYFHEYQRSRVTANGHQARKALTHRQLIETFLLEYPDIRSGFSKQKIRELTDGELLRRGYVCYWDRDLVSARRIFRRVLRSGYGSTSDLRYLLPAVLPLFLYRSLIQLIDKQDK